MATIDEEKKHSKWSEEIIDNLMYKRKQRIFQSKFNWSMKMLNTHKDYDEVIDMII